MDATDLEAKLAGGLYPLARQVSEALVGAVYPLARRELVWVARENEAPATLLTLLSDLKAGPYLSLADVQEALEERGTATGTPTDGGASGAGS